MPNLIPPPFYKTKLIDKDGYISDPWAKFIRQLFERVGGVSQDSGEGFSGDISALESTDEDLQNQINAVQQEPVS